MPHIRETDITLNGEPCFIMPKSPSIESLSSTEEDDIEMANLEDIAVTPDPRLSHNTSGPKHVTFETPESDDDEEDELDRENENEMALLGSPQRTRGRERIWGQASGWWPQVKGIVIEVRRNGH